MSSLVHRYTYTPSGDIVLVLTPAECIGLRALADEGAEGLLNDKPAAAAYIGNRSRIAAAERALEVVKIAAGAAQQLMPRESRRKAGV